MGKRKRSEVQKVDKSKVKQKDAKEDSEEVATYRFSNEISNRKGKWINRQRVLVFATRGITYRDRHLLMNLRKMMPHSKTESKMDSKDPTIVINEICETRNANKCIFFENRKHKDLYMWLSNVPTGPSVKFLVENVHTMEEMRLTGNCLKGSRPILSFDPLFDQYPHYTLLKELFIQIFATPNNHPKSQPFIDHVITFTILDNRIWYRNYQIVEEDGSLVEIGPRFVLNVIKIFEGSFGGQVIYTNDKYVSPNRYRAMLLNEAKTKYVDRLAWKEGKKLREPKGEEYADIDPQDIVFDTIKPEEAKGVEKQVFQRKQLVNKKMKKKQSKQMA